MKISITLLSCILMLSFFIPAISAQENPDTSYWKFGGLGSIALSQVSLTNWAAGGENSFSGNILANGIANYKKDKTTWDNLLILGYGLMKQGSTGTRKTDDRIDLSSKYGRYAFEHWSYSALFNFNTQFAEGFAYPNDSVAISKIMAPGYINLALGMDFKPSDNFTLFIGPVAGKITFVLDDTLSSHRAFGVEAGKKVRYEFGGLIKSMYTREIVKNVTFLTRLDLFSNYLHNPQMIDVNWEVLLNMKINKYLSANLNTLLVWDDDIKFNNQGLIDPNGKSKVQFKEIFGIGLSATF